MINKGKKRNFEDNFIYSSTNYILWFLQCNFYFWLMNIPFILVLLLMFLSQSTSLTLFLTLSALPIGPALTAILSVMGKLIREKDVNVTKDFFKFYKINFFESIFFWALELAILIIIFTDKLYILSHFNNTLLQIIFTFVLFFCASLTFHIFPILSRFYLRRLDIIKLSLYYSIKKIYISILSFSLIYIMWIILTKISSISLLIILLSISILCYVVMYLHKNTFLDLEEKFKDNAE